MRVSANAGFGAVESGVTRDAKWNDSPLIHKLWCRMAIDPLPHTLSHVVAQNGSRCHGLQRNLFGDWRYDFHLARSPTHKLCTDSYTGFLFGYDSGIITSTIALPTFKEYFNDPSDDVVGGIVSAFQGGAIAGTIFNMLFADMLGRRWTIFVGAVISILGSSLQAGAVNMAMLIIGRFIGGVAVGQLTSTIPMYAGELSEAKYRGTLSGLLQWMLSWGFFVAQWLGYGCSFNSSQFSCKST